MIKRGPAQGCLQWRYCRQAFAYLLSYRVITYSTHAAQYMHACGLSLARGNYFALEVSLKSTVSVYTTNEMEILSHLISPLWEKKTTL